MKATPHPDPITALAGPEARNSSTVIVIASSTILVAFTQLLQTIDFWVVNRHDAAVIAHLTPWLALILQSVTPIALSALLAASVGLLLRKPWGRPLFTWSAVVWMLAVTCLHYWIMSVVNLPVYLLAIWLLYRTGKVGAIGPLEAGARSGARRVASLSCTTLSCTLHFWAWIAAISPTSWVWSVIPHGHPWYLLAPAAILLVAGVALADRSTRLWSAGIGLTVFCVAMGAVLVASVPVSTSLYRLVPEPRMHAYLPYHLMITYLALVGGIAFALRQFSRRRSRNRPL